MRCRPLLLAFLATVIVAGSMGAGLAPGPAVAEAQASSSGGGAVGAGGAPSFQDLSAVPWAVPAIEGMAVLGVMDGTAPGQFDPQGTTTRAQMAVVLDRLLAWPASGAAGATGSAGRFTDQSQIPAWARAAVAAAARHGILRGELGGVFDPNGPVTWAQLAVIAARAFGYPPVPAGSQQAYLAELPSGSVTPGWAADATARDVQAGALTGVLASLFEPDQPVSRAALADFLMSAAPGVGNPNLLSGRLTAVQGQSVTVATGGGVQSLSAAPSPTVFLGATPMRLDQLTPGDSVSLVLEGGQVAWLQVTSVPTGASATTAPSTPSGTSSSGTPAAISGSPVAAIAFSPSPVAASGTLGAGAAVSLTLTAQAAGGQPLAGATLYLSFTAAPGGGAASAGATVLGPSPVPFVTGASGTLSLTYTAPASPPAAGTDSVMAANAPSGATVTAVDSYTFTPGASATVTPNSTLTGTVQAVNGSQSLTLVESGGTVVTIGLAPSPVVTFEGQSSSVGAVVAGDSVTVGLNAAAQAASVAVTGTGAATGTVTPNSTVTGTVEAVNGNQSLTLSESGGTVVTVPFASYVTVLLNGQSSTFGAIGVGDSATVTVNGSGQASYVNIATLGTTTGGLQPNSVVTGTVQAVSPGQALTLNESGGTSVSIPLSSGVSVEYNSRPSSIGVVTAGQQVTVTVNALGQASFIDVIAGVGGVGTVPAPGAVLSGTLEAVNGAQTLTLAVNGGTVEALPLATYVTVTVNGTLSSLLALASGQQVTVTLNSSEQVATISASSIGYGTGSLGPGATASGTVEGVNGSQSITVAVNGSQVTTLPLYPYVTVTQNGALSSLAAVVVGDQITFSLNSSDEVATIVITGYGNGAYGANGSTVRGVVEAVEGTQSITLSENGSAPVALPLASSVGVTVDGTSSALTEVAVGDTVQITLNALQQVAQINVVSSSVAAPTGGTLVSGILAALNTSNQQVGVYSSGGLSTYTLASGATVTLAGQSTGLGSLTFGDNVSLALNSSGQASGVAATAPVPPEQAYTGTLVNSPAGSLLELSTPNSGTGTVSLNVGSEAVAVKNGSLTLLSNLPPGTQVTVITQVAPDGSALVIAG